MVAGPVADMQSVTTQLDHLIVHAKLDLTEAGSLGNAKVGVYVLKSGKDVPRGRVCVRVCERQ